ncbi:FAD/NAD(P)-binding protein [Rhizobium sp. G187]|uniref:FAD/NAD(P)-binding protein n=1 Tax=Rhizobium sp. G187 TaxID=3451352 RepID=UPI003EE81081
MLPRIAIIGTGPTGLYTFKQLVASTVPLSLTLYEAEGEPGKGTPYHPDVNDPAMLSNIPSIELPAFTETLVGWLRRQTDARLMELGVMRNAIDDREFYPRVVLGDYMQEQFDRLCETARANGHDLSVLARHKVIDIELQPEQIRLRVENADGQSDALFDHVVMATGHNWPDTTEVRPGYFVSPWPAAALKTVRNERVGILGTSLSGIDALMTVATAHGMFYADANGDLQYQPAEGTEDFHATMMSRKGLLPEADFYCPLPYMTPRICTEEAIDALIASGRHDLLDDVFDLFRREIVAADPDYAARIGLSQLTVETFAAAYYRDRVESDPFVWAARNLAETEENRIRQHTVPWRYAILITHEIVARVIPHLDEQDLKRFHRHFKGIFIDDYATVPLTSIRRLLALSRVGKLDILKLGEDYKIRTAEDGLDRGAEVTVAGDAYRFGAFIDATGQETLSATDLPFPTLVAQGGVKLSETPVAGTLRETDRALDTVRTGGIDVDEQYRPKTTSSMSNRLYCAAIAFLLHKEPFVQGITSARDIGETVGNAILADVMESETRLFQIPA